VTKRLYHEAILDFDKAIELCPQYEMAYTDRENAYKAQEESEAKSIVEAAAIIQAKAKARPQAEAEAMSMPNTEAKAQGEQENRSYESNWILVNSIIEKLIEPKIYIGILIGVFIDLIGITIVLRKRRKSDVIEPIDFF